MELTDFIKSLNSLAKHRNGNEWVVVSIPISKLFATVGGSPRVAVENIQAGFDWDSGQMFIIPKEPLMLVSEHTEASETIKNLQDKNGWLEYEANGYKSEIKRLKRKVKELENANLQQTN